jgi:hypothetical protein
MSRDITKRAGQDSNLRLGICSGAHERAARRAARSCEAG